MAVRQKIGALTFHRCINYGSYWQARCLVEGLRTRGHDVVLLDHTCCRATRAEWRCALQPLLPARSPGSDLPLYANKARRFFDAFASLPRSRRFDLDDPAGIESYDLAIVGSDEVWNLNHPWYGGHPLFFGTGLRASVLASYAASFGSHNVADGLDRSWADRLRNFTWISVRDENSRLLIRDALDREPELVLDPCLQFPPEAPICDAPAERPYAAVYGHTFPDWFQQSVRLWGKSRNFRLVSIGYRNDWADEQQISAGPDEFRELMAGASAVATNFFHGCVFALLNATPFVCVPTEYRFNKIHDLTVTVSAQRHLVSQRSAQSHYASLLNEPLDPATLGQIAMLRQRSNIYLDHVLG